MANSTSTQTSAPTSTQTAHKHLPWQDATRIVVGLVFAAIVGGFFIAFSDVISSVILSLILAYVTYPMAAWLHRRTRLRWSAAAVIVFVLLASVSTAVMAVAGISVGNELVDVADKVQDTITRGPEIIAALPRVIDIGPWHFPINLDALIADTDGLRTLAQRLASLVGSVVGAIVTSSVSLLTTGALTFLVALFVLIDVGPQPGAVLGRLTIPDYEADIERLRAELQRIWSIYLRTQVVLFALTLVVYWLAMRVLGVNYAVAIAVLAGLARFIPYIGPAIVWGVTVIIAVVQGSGHFGMEGWVFAVVVFVVSFVIDSAFDYGITPRLAGDALGVPVSLLLLSATVLGSLLGFVGLLLSAPLLATMLLFMGYAFKRLTGQEPWPPDGEAESAAEWFGVETEGAEPGDAESGEKQPEETEKAETEEKEAAPRRMGRRRSK